MKATKFLIAAGGCLGAGLAAHFIIGASQVAIVVASGVGAFKLMSTCALGAIGAGIGLGAWGGVTAIKDKAKQQIKINEERKLADPNRLDPVERRKLAVERYLDMNTSTDFFRNLLYEMVKLIEQFGKKQNTLFAMLQNRFDGGTLSYNKFSAPVEDIRNRILKLIDNLVTRMEAFNEEEFVQKISALQSKGRYDEAKEYEELQDEYAKYAEGVDKVLNNAVLRLDRLILEMAKLSDSELQTACESLRDMDEVIQSTKLYDK